MQTDIFSYLNPSPSSSAEQGPLAGKTFTVQPNMSVRGWPAEAGAVALKGFVAIDDAMVIERLKKAGATIIGSSRMSELGLGLTGDTVSQILSEGRSDMALMTDTMGEARLTAARIGVCAFKPTYGIVSRFGLIGLVPSMECYGILARLPEDIAAVMGIIAGDDERDFSMYSGNTPCFSQVPATDGSMNTFGVVRECLNTLNEREQGAFRDGLNSIKKLGFRIKEVDLPDYDLFLTVHHIVGSVEASSSCGKYDGVRYGHRSAAARNWNEMYLKSRAESFGPQVKTYLFQGAYFQFENFSAFEKASRIRARLIKSVDNLYADVDALAFPARRAGFHDTPSKDIDDIYDDFALTLPANVIGTPAIQMPGYVIDGNDDYGLQIIGPRLSDVQLLSMAARLSHFKQGI